MSRRVTVLLSLLLIGFTVDAVARKAPAEPVIPEAFRDARAIVLEEKIEWVGLLKGNSTYKFRRRILIQNRRGFGLADGYLIYGRRGSKLKSFKARTVLPDGSKVNVPDDLRRERVLYKDGDTDLRILQFTFPAVEPGAVLEWSYEIKTGRPSWVRYWTPQRTIPVLDASFTATTSRSERYTMKLYPRNPYEDWCVITESSDLMQSKQVRCHNLPAHDDEVLSPPDEDVRIQFAASFSSKYVSSHLSIWKSLHNRRAEQIGEFVEVRAEAGRKARELTEGVTSGPEKVECIDRFVRQELKLREEWETSGLEGERGEAENVDEVLRRGGGPSRDLTLLTLVLLQEAGIEADAILVQDRKDGRFDWEFPGFTQVDHLMLRVKVDGQDRFLDPACESCETWLPPWRYCSSAENGIVVRPGQTAPQRVLVHEPPPEANSERRSETIRLDADGSATVIGSVEWSGQQGSRKRRSWRGRSGSWRRDAVSRSLPGDVSEVKVTVFDPDEPAERPVAGYEYRRSDQAMTVGDRMLIRPTDFFTGWLGFLHEDHRQQPIRLNFQRTIASEVLFVLPDGYDRQHGLPERLELEGPGIRFEGQWNETDRSNELAWRGVLWLTATEVGEEQYGELREFASELRRRLRGGLCLSRDGADAS